MLHIRAHRTPEPDVASRVRVLHKKSEPRDAVGRRTWQLAQRPRPSVFSGDIVRGETTDANDDDTGKLIHGIAETLYDCTDVSHGPNESSSIFKVPGTCLSAPSPSSRACLAASQFSDDHMLAPSGCNASAATEVYIPFPGHCLTGTAEAFLSLEWSSRGTSVRKIRGFL
ncbi:hypothetical protein FVEG_10865 [Fusarium verticillioides 7600]|uniref:Uncharacterized protein n=1 Tax=Gibberella moniliformis (strain M3125 / FGSC 7600) TaxID=334819 RepID=W7MWJ4_GIBM7|nr:hypothetical protein FVEG_10865 [Fusarium verticillioides 7600]EWG52035.1 hypothetical protein FVEG_10865 [Fusarium verticillioides 7600]